MMPLDPSIIGGLKTPEPMSLGDIMDLSRGSLAYQKEKALFEPSIEKGKAESQTAQTLANTTKLENLYRHQAQSSRDLVKLLNQKEPITSETIKEHVVKTMTNAGAPQKAIDTALMDLPTGGTDKENRAFIARHATNSFSAEAQLEKLFPGSQMVSTGQQTVPTATGSALAYIPPGTQQGPAIQQQLPPATQSVAQPGDNSGLPPGTPYFLGPQGQPQVGQAPQGVTPSMMSQPKITSGLAPATSALITAQATNYATDFAKTQETASSSEPRVALFQNIKKLAPESFTGVGSAKKELLSGIAQAVGMDVYTMEKMSTDELAKSSAMLSLAGGNTDAARLMAEAANPNKKMNEGAIKQIADQMIGMERMNQAKYKLLAPVQTNPQEYANRLAQFNKINDFRIFQESTPEQVKSLKGSMSINEQKVMSEKIKLARQLGLI